MGCIGGNLGITIGSLPAGRRNTIADAGGVTVGHRTVCDGDVQTGVTAILPHGGDLFHDKVPASCYVINGFGKSVGLLQIDELGTLETPILLTNTLSVGVCSTALVRYMLGRCPDIAKTTSTVNPVVCECNDGRLNDIRGMHVGEEDALEALAAAKEDFEEGAVGAGRGMRCFGLKGGIGSASRIIRLDGDEYAVGALVLSNFGNLDRLTVAGDAIGARIAAVLEPTPAKPPSLSEPRPSESIGSGDRGSIIVIIATDVPMDARQLKRLCKRAGVGLARTGSYFGNGSGDVIIAFSTAERIPHYPNREIRATRVIHEDAIDKTFVAAAEAVEESVISSLLHAEAVTGRDGGTTRSLAEFLGGNDRLTGIRKIPGSAEPGRSS